jgi:uncharacterized protein YcbK (DUF882 family)
MCCFCSDCAAEILSPAPPRPAARLTSRLVSRRGVIAGAGAAALAGFAARPARAQQVEFRRQVMRLNIVNRSTGERFEGVFWHHGTYNIGAINQINAVLRDQRAGAAVQIDLPLLDLLERIQFRVRRPLAVVSAYRTYETNQALRASDPNVAQNSFHIRGQAVDFAVDGLSAAQVAQLARQAGAGGIGTYTGSNFVHVDTGPHRAWNA